MELKFDTKIEAGEIVVIKTVAGEEVIGSVTSVKDGEVTIEKALCVTFQMNPNGQYGPSMIQYFVSVPMPECTLVLKESAIIGRLKAIPKGLKDQYLQLTTDITLNTGSLLKG